MSALAPWRTARHRGGSSAMSEGRQLAARAQARAAGYPFQGLTVLRIREG